MNDFIKAIGSTEKGYRAFVDIGDGKIGITPSYSKKFLEEVVIPEILEANPLHKVLKIEESKFNDI